MRKLSEKEVKLLVFIDDKVDDPVRLSHQLDFKESELNTALEKLEKNSLVLVKKKGNKPFSVKITAAGQEYLKKHKSEYC
ncbi:MAG TPA: hypothetical protein VJA47_04720 [archaeon]|nr:hypothetical protein [archaeon]